MKKQYPKYSLYYHKIKHFPEYSVSNNTIKVIKIKTEVSSIV